MGVKKSQPEVHSRTAMELSSPKKRSSKVSSSARMSPRRSWGPKGTLRRWRLGGCPKKHNGRARLLSNKRQHGHCIEKMWNSEHYTPRHHSRTIFAERDPQPLPPPPPRASGKNRKILPTHFAGRKKERGATQPPCEPRPSALPPGRPAARPPGRPARRSLDRLIAPLGRAA